MDFENEREKYSKKVKLFTFFFFCNYLFSKNKYYIKKKEDNMVKLFRL